MYMKRIRFYCFCVLAPVLCACERIDVTPTPVDPDIPQKSKDLYYCAVEYDPSYDWRRDSLGGNVDTRLLLFKNHKLQLTLSLGKESSIVGDCDMHRVIEGSLYSLHPDGGRTALRKDGIDLFFLDANEYVHDILLKDGSVFTLSSTSSDNGWRLRKDGQIVCQESSAMLMGGLYEDMGDLCFAWAQLVQSSSDSRSYRYFFNCNGENRQIEPGVGVQSLVAVRRHKSVMNILQKEANMNGLVWLQGQSSFVISQTNGHDSRDYSFVAAADQLYAHAQVNSSYDDGENFWNDYFWLPLPGSNSVTDRTSVTVQVLAFCPDDHGLCYVCSPYAASSRLMVYHNGQKHNLDEKYLMVSPYALCCSATRYCIGLNDAQQNYRPVVIDGQQTVEHDFNGYFTRFYLP